MASELLIDQAAPVSQSVRCSSQPVCKSVYQQLQSQSGSLTFRKAEKHTTNVISVLTPFYDSQRRAVFVMQLQECFVLKALAKNPAISFYVGEYKQNKTKQTNKQKKCPVQFPWKFYKLNFKIYTPYCHVPESD